MTARSLLERAAEIYDFDAALRGRQPARSFAEAPRPVAQPQTQAQPEWRAPAGQGVEIDREALRAGGYIEPGRPVGALAEEFRVAKRALLRALGPDPRDRAILVCSAQPGDGKSFCAINLALSIASERDHEVLLVDADFPKPGVTATLGLGDGPGLMDALADPAVDVESLVVGTDVPKLSLLRAGQRTVHDSEYLASSRTADVVARLLANPRRIVLFDSPPLLAVSHAAVLAPHAGQALLVVRADRTHESDLRQSVAALGPGPRIHLLLNAVSYRAGGRRFGSYYGVEP